MATTLDDLVENDLEERWPLEHLGGGAFYHHGPVVITPPGDEPSAENISAHELSHFWLHSSTPYGLLLDDLAEMQDRAAVEYCASLHKTGRSIPIAAYEVARRLLTAPPPTDAYRELLRRVVDEHVVPWSHDSFLERWFEGVDSRTVRATRLPRTLRWVVDFEERSRAMRPDTELFADGAPEFSEYQRNLVRWWADHVAEDTGRYPRHPTVGVAGGEMRPLGGRHLFEAHAQLSETVDEPFWESAPSDARELYWGLLAAFLTRFPGRVHDEDTYRSMVRTFVALVELALMVPVGRVYGRLRDDQMTWFDLHPGWRFERLLRETGDDDWLQDTGEPVRDLLWTLSRRCGWPGPERFLELGASLEPVTGDIARHAAACRVRLDEPDLLAVPRALPDRPGPVKHFEEHGPIIIRGTQSYVLGGDVHDKLSRLLGFFNASMTLMVMQHGRVDVDEIFPPNLDFTNVFTNIASREELLELFHSVVPFLAPEAFCSADTLDLPA